MGGLSAVAHGWRRGENGFQSFRKVDTQIWGLLRLGSGAEAEPRMLLWFPGRVRCLSRNPRPSGAAGACLLLLESWGWWSGGAGVSPEAQEAQACHCPAPSRVGLCAECPQDVRKVRPHGAIRPEVGVHGSHSPTLGTTTQADTGVWGCQKSPQHLPCTFCALLQGVESVKKEIDDSVLGQTGPYRRPERLRKRKEFAGEKFKEEKVFEPNE